MLLTIKPGVTILFNGQRYKIKSPLSLEKVLIVSLDGEETLSASLSEIKPYTPNNKQETKDKTKATIEFTKQEWAEAKKREKLIRPFLSASCPIQNAEEIAAKSGVSARYVYKLIRRYQSSGGNFTSLLPAKRTGGMGQGRINTEAEKLIEITINELYLTKQKLKISFVVEEIFRRCRYSNLKAPSERTIRRRIENIPAKHTVTKREGSKTSREEYAPIIGSFPEVTQPLAVLQIDHTPVDLIIVDEFHRKPIGRPYLTIAIDVFSRCITGFCLTLEAPSAISVGLCLSHSIFDKDTWCHLPKISSICQRSVHQVYRLWR